MTRERARTWDSMNYGYPGWTPSCPTCGFSLDECACVCAFCGERDGCRCCIGLGIATGGG